MVELKPRLSPFTDDEREAMRRARQQAGNRIAEAHGIALGAVLEDDERDLAEYARRSSEFEEDATDGGETEEDSSSPDTKR